MTYWVYIMSNRSHRLYIGVTNNLPIRVAQHREMRAGTFTARYRLTRLVFYEGYGDVRMAITREKELKGWSRAKKIALIRGMNPTWEDLAEQPGFFLPA
jgi:putative endonuclease